MTEYEPRHAEPTIKEVAVKRGWQTLLTGLATDITVAAAIIIATVVVPGMESWESVVRLWPVWLLALTRSTLQALAAWAIRRWADKAGTEINAVG